MFRLDNVERADFCITPEAAKSKDEIISTHLRSLGVHPLRWAITGARTTLNTSYVDIEATVVTTDIKHRTKFSPSLLGEKPVPEGKPRILFIVPTGLRAAVGGFLGDALPAARALARLGGIVVTHPNVCNGGTINLMDPKRMFYVADAYGIDRFAEGKIVLEPVRRNRVGVIIDRGSDDNLAKAQAVNQVKNFYAHSGEFDLAGIKSTDEPVGGRAEVSEKSGVMRGEVKNIETVFRAGERLIAGGATALAVFTFVSVPESYWTDYFAPVSRFPNPVGAVEANISHALVYRFGIPAAHAPLLEKHEVDFLRGQGLIANPAAGNDSAIPFYIGSVLRGLEHAPRFVSAEARYAPGKDALHISNISVVVAPASAMGGIPMMRAEAMGIPIIGVLQNETVLNVTATSMGYENAITLGNYLEVVGLLSLMQELGKDYSTGVLAECAGKHRDELEDKGRAICEKVGIVPETLLRPLIPPRLNGFDFE